MEPHIDVITLAVNDLEAWREAENRATSRQKWATRRRRNRTYQATGYAALPVLKTGSATRPVPPHAQSRLRGRAMRRRSSSLEGCR
jgi:hypothetical protein